MLQIIIALVAVFLVWNFWWKRRHLPPGPTPLPFLGNLATMGRLEPGYDAFINWRKQYGPVYTYWIGTMPMVAIAEYQLLKETFVKDGEGYMDKFHVGETLKLYRGGEYGVVDANGDLWREHRRFALHQLRDMGLGKNLMEQRVQSEVDALMDSISNQKDKDINVSEDIDLAVGSVINQLLFGYRFDKDRVEEFLYIKDLISEQMRTFAHPMALIPIMYPFMFHAPYFNNFRKKLIQYRESFFGFFKKQIEEHEKHIDFDSDETTDFVDAFLKEKKRREEDGDTETYSIIQLQNMCLDLWIAGMETSSNTISWAIVYSLNHPEVQDKIHAELDKEIGSPRTITMSDKNSLVYVQAVISEVQRLANLLPQNLFHITTKDVVVGGYHLKKDTPIVAQISAVLYDETVFPEPYAFKPERFLDENGKLKKVDELIPFSIGKRQCLGEPLARMELFLFTANLFNRFKLLPVDGAPAMTKSFGITVQPKHYKIRVEERK